MNCTVIKLLPSIDELIQAYPLSVSAKARITKDRNEIKAILSGKDTRLLMIVGPCSAWPKAAVLVYAQELLAINEQVKDQLKLVMRVYIQKPRTTKGWTGPVNQPDPFLPPDIEAGIHYARDMMRRVVEMGLPIADEALFTHNARGFLELLSWVAIGARSSEDQEHRIFASGINCAVGLKNPTHGSLAVAVNSLVAAQHSHVAALDGYAIQTEGNPYAHLVLRGSAGKPNYSVENLEKIQHGMAVQKINNPAVLIDASHDNCWVNGVKDPLQQVQVVKTVLNNMERRPALKSLVKGFMIESFIKTGSQPIRSKRSDQIDCEGLSITDPCLGLEETKRMLLELAMRRRSDAK